MMNFRKIKKFGPMIFCVPTVCFSLDCLCNIPMFSVEDTVRLQAKLVRERILWTRTKSSHQTRARFFETKKTNFMSFFNSYLLPMNRNERIQATVAFITWFDPVKVVLIIKKIGTQIFMVGQPTSPIAPFISHNLPRNHNPIFTLAWRHPFSRNTNVAHQSLVDSLILFFLQTIMFYKRRGEKNEIISIT